MARERYVPTFKSKDSPLAVPEIDNSFYETLKESKRSQASKANIEPEEKPWRQLHFKIADLGKPLLYLTRQAITGERKRSKRRAKEEAIAARHALKLYAILLSKVKFMRRSIFMRQLYPRYQHLLQTSANLDCNDFLFGPKFIKEMKTEAATESALEKAKAKEKRYNSDSKKHSFKKYNNDKYESFFTTPSILPLAEAPFGGRLCRFSAAWHELTNDSWVLGVIGDGFKIDFVSEPFQNYDEAIKRCISTANALSQEQFDLCTAEVDSLLEKGAISETDDKGFLSTIFVIPKKSGGHRPIINLKPLNKFVHAPHFKMENLDTVRFTIRQVDWCAKIDLKDAYLTVPIWKGHRKFLQFLWKGRTFQFTCLPFGLSASPWVFTKVLRVAAAHLRKNGIRMVIYLDDILLMGASKEKTTLAVNAAISLLTGLGFVINEKKSEPIPTQSIEFLGIGIDSTKMQFFLPESKVEAFSSRCRATLDSGTLMLRDLASLIGLLNWAVTAFGHGRAHLRGCQMLYNDGLLVSNGDLSVRTELSVAAKLDLEWWLVNLKHSGVSIVPPRPALVIYSDASLTGWRAACRNVKTGGHWTKEQQNKQTSLSSWQLYMLFKRLQFQWSTARWS